MSSQTPETPVQRFGRVIGDWAKAEQDRENGVPLMTQHWPNDDLPPFED